MTAREVEDLAVRCICLNFLLNILFVILFIRFGHGWMMLTGLFALEMATFDWFVWRVKHGTKVSNP